MQLDWCNVLFRQQLNLNVHALPRCGLKSDSCDVTSNKRSLYGE